MATTLIASPPELIEHEASPREPRRLSKAKWLVLIAILLATVAAGALFYARRSGKPEYTTATVDRGDIESAITATGNCNAVVTVQVGSQVSGNIIALYADFNTKVKQGQLVARIDPAIFKAQVDQAKANLDTAKAAAHDGAGNAPEIDIGSGQRASQRGGAEGQRRESAKRGGAG